jgi:hypothetical protein
MNRTSFIIAALIGMFLLHSVAFLTGLQDLAGFTGFILKKSCKSCRKGFTRPPRCHRYGSASPNCPGLTSR